VGYGLLDGEQDVIRVDGFSHVEIVSISLVAKKKVLFVSHFLLLLAFQTLRSEEEGHLFSSSLGLDSKEYAPDETLPKHRLDHQKPLRKRMNRRISSSFFFFV